MPTASDARRRGGADSSRFWPADQYEVGRSQPSFDKQYVRPGRPAPAGTRPRPRRRSPGRGRRHAGALRHRLREAGQRAVLRLAGARRGVRARSADPAEGGSWTRRARPSSARCRRWASPECATSTSAASSSSTSRTRIGCPRCASSCSPNSWRTTRSWTAGPLEFGVVQFPAPATRSTRSGPPHASRSRRTCSGNDHDLQGVEAVIVPATSHGDYLRAGALARFSPLMAEVERFAAHGGLVLGICNGFQVLCGSGMLPGTLLPNLLRFVCRQVDVDVVNPATKWTATCERRRRSPCRPSRPAATGRRTRCSTSSRPTARSCCATRPATGSTAPARDIAGVSNRAGNVVGLMLRNSSTRSIRSGLGGRAAAVRVGRAGRRARDPCRRRARGDPVPSSEATDAEYERIIALMGREAQRGGARRVQPHVVGAAATSTPQAAADAAHRGPARRDGAGENARGRRRRGLACAFKVESHNHPSAVEPFQGGDRRRRDPARRVRGPARARSRCSTPASRSRGRSARATCSTARSRASATTATRSASPRSAGDLLRGLRAELPRQRDVPRPDR